MADRRELSDKLPQWEEDVGSRERGPDERARGEVSPRYERKPGKPDLLTRQRAFEEEFAAIQVRRFRLQGPPDRPAEGAPPPNGGPATAPTAAPAIDDVTTHRPTTVWRNPIRLIRRLLP